ncbi:MAG: hypothetical protein GY952_08500 [Rhodobacteraceae bacterium]|nr:hypothetical protein [Paracoccaceae bacterium]
MQNLLNPAVVLLFVALPFCIWAALTDLRQMKILNVTNMGLFLCFAVVGVFLFPLDQYGLRLSQAALMLVVGILATSFGFMGGGDSKFIAAMAPFIALNDAPEFLFLLAAMSLLTVALHRGVGAVTPLRARLDGWKSWNAGGKFPFGVTLSSTLVLYLVMQVAKL